MTEPTDDELDAVLLYTAGAVPLTPFIPAQRERLYNNRPVNVGKGASLADWHRIVQFIEAAHGIKGGQHG